MAEKMKSRYRFATVKFIAKVLGYNLTNRSLIKLGIYVSKRVKAVKKIEVIHKGEKIMVNLYEKTANLFDVVEKFLCPMKLATVDITAMLEGFKLTHYESIQLGKHIVKIFNVECKVPAGKYKVNAYHDTIEYREAVYQWCKELMY